MIALTRNGLASDAELSGVVSELGTLIAVRLLLPFVRQESGCGHAPGPDLVAVSPQDAALPPDQAAAVRPLAPGAAIADQTWAELRGGTVALAGIDIRITGVAKLTDSTAPGPIVLTLSDLATGLSATEARHAPVVRTLIVVPGVAAGEVPAGWRVVAVADGGGIPISAGLDDPSTPVTTGASRVAAPAERSVAA